MIIKFFIYFSCLYFLCLLPLGVDGTIVCINKNNNNNTYEEFIRDFIYEKKFIILLLTLSWILIAFYYISTQLYNREKVLYYVLFLVFVLYREIYSNCYYNIIIQMYIYCIFIISIKTENTKRSRFYSIIFKIPHVRHVCKLFRTHDNVKYFSM